MTDLTSRPAVQVITAGRAGEVAQEREGNGLFTRVLLKGLGGAADRRGWGWLSLDHLGEYVRDRVYAESGKQQYPQFGNLSGDGQFVFVLPGTRADSEAERLHQDRARVQEERRKLEAEKAGLERKRLEAERRKIEVERKQLAEERKRGAALQSEREKRARPKPKPPRVAVGPPTTPHEIGTGLNTMVKVPAGWFIMGRDKGFGGEESQRRVYIDSFYIDKYPVTNSQFRWFGNPKGNVVMTKKYGSKFNGDHQPVVGVTWYQARDYCKSVGKRLPTEAEWEKAARGVDGRKYPWGNEWDPSKVIWKKNSGGRTHAVDRSYNTHRSPYGAVDMMGNVSEWMADKYAKDYYQSAPDRNPKGPASGFGRVLRGGSWYGSYSVYFRTAYRTGTYLLWNINLGFRCAKAP